MCCLYIRKVERKKKEKKRKKCSTLVKPWLMRRDAFGFYNTLMYELRTEDVEEYTRFLSVSSCFLFMVAILPFLISTLVLFCETEISQERIFFILNTFMQKIYDSPIRRQYISILQSLFKFKGKSLH